MMQILQMKHLHQMLYSIKMERFDFSGFKNFGLEWEVFENLFYAANVSFDT